MGDNNLSTILTNLAKDLVEMENMGEVTDQTLDEITVVYSNVYTIIMTIFTKTSEK